MTVTETQPSLWDTAVGARRGRKPRQPAGPRCALCTAVPASDFGLCADCLREAAAELARVIPRPADPDDPRPSAVRYADLCGRCGGWDHPRMECRA
jgi:ribosomal protein S14